MKLLLAVYAGGWVNFLRMRGGTSKSYALSVMLCDFIIYVIFTQGLYIANVVYGVDQEGWQPLLWAYTLAQVLFITAFNVVMLFKQWAIGIRIGILAIQFLILNFLGFFCGDYIEATASNKVDLVSMIGCFSPTI